MFRSLILQNKYCKALIFNFPFVFQIRNKKTIEPLFMRMAAITISIH